MSDFISIIIPVFDDVAGLEVTLASIRATSWSKEKYEIVVCNDGGGREISNVVERFAAREANLPRNSGSYAARNAGIAIAKGRLLAFLDADQVVDDQWLHSGIIALESADYVGGNIVVVTKESDPWLDYDCEYSFDVQEKLRRGFAPTANLFVNRSVFVNLGFFRADLMSGGDFEFGNRVRSAGVPQFYESRAITYHPARTRQHQLNKMRRVSGGEAELNIRVYGEHWAKIALMSLFHLTMVPIELLWRSLKILVLPRYDNKSKQLRFVWISKQLKAARNYWVVVAALRIAGDRYFAYQDHGEV